MHESVASRNSMEEAVRRELFGPMTTGEDFGEPLDLSRPKIEFPSSKEARGPFHDLETGEEIIASSDPRGPLGRYGIGILHGGRSGQASAGQESSTVDRQVDEIAGLGFRPEGTAAEEGPLADVHIGEGAGSSDRGSDDDFDLGDANRFQPSAVGITFKIYPEDESGSLRIRVRGAYYDNFYVHVKGEKENRHWWVRRPFEATGFVSGEHLSNISSRRRLDLSPKPPEQLYVEAFVREVPKHEDSLERLVTITAVNQARSDTPKAALFQLFLDASPEGPVEIVPYDSGEHHLGSAGDEELESLALLYRNRKTFAIGHGCAANWEADLTAATRVSTDPLPGYEVPAQSPDVFVATPGGGRKRLSVSMAELANFSREGRIQVDELLEHYKQWIMDLELQMCDLEPKYSPAAERHVSKAKEMLERFHRGWILVKTDDLVQEAFKLANKAMFEQQLRSKLPIRRATFNKKRKTVSIEGPHPTLRPEVWNGKWRPFQIAFILAVLPELVYPDSLGGDGESYRETADLLFFPTGGGKTEAYLGAAAISILSRRLKNPKDGGTDVIMRYTLRLLTSQQFLRAASLICVLEDLRSRNKEKLGAERISIGAWLGGETTPNTWKQASNSLRDLEKNRYSANTFLLLKCPWCGAEMGPIPAEKQRRIAVGYRRAGRGEVVFSCGDRACRFGGAETLPIHVVDEALYEKRPTFLLGTVDKFAMLAWRPEARRMFGFPAPSRGNSREVSPPNLIIQDEFHLISGPLGSMVGLYEVAIEELCTGELNGAPIKPKIIASTATIRRSDQQVKGVFGRESVALFPPRGLEDDHSFFSEPAIDERTGEALPGRRYLGLFSASFKSMQTLQVRTTAALLQGAAGLDDDFKDGYWTNLSFFNSLRELGNTVSLIQSDVRDYLTGIRRRDGVQVRWPERVEELTSRRKADEIPRALQQLETKYGVPGCIDICLASSIIEVGVDVDRLGLMTIIGQPKTTAQYIQVSGRVGRKPEKAPGLVLTLYGAAKPRDRSHYEQFRSYHEKLYAQVEPTSVTPFAKPALLRGMHGALISLIRQARSELGPYPFPSEAFTEVVELFKNRAGARPSAYANNVDEVSAKYQREWAAWQKTEWDANKWRGGDPEAGLIQYASTHSADSYARQVWDVPTSMRTVDAECRIEITSEYAAAKGQGDG